MYWLLSLIFFHVLACNPVNQDELLSVIKSEYNSPSKKRIFTNSGFNGGSEIPRKYKYMQNRSNPSDEFNDSENENKRSLDELIFNGLISVTPFNEGTFVNKYNILIYRIEYEINVTDKGKEFLVGETTDNYIFNVYDYDDFRIVDKPKVSGDTINFTYTINKIAETPAFKCMNEWEQKQPYTNLNMPHWATFVIRDNKPVLVKLL